MIEWTALAAEMLSMGSVEENAVHPFFRQIKDSARHTIGALSGAADTAIVVEDAVERYSQAWNSKSTGLQAQILIPPSPRTSIPPPLPDQVRDSHGEILPNSLTVGRIMLDADRQVESAQLKIDMNDERRKRRRTVSPHSEPLAMGLTSNSTWDEQLGLAATDSEVVSDPKTQPEPRRGSPHNQPMHKENELFTPTMTIAEKNEANANNLNTKVTGRSTKLLTSPKKQLPERKMLRLRSDGKLSSPKRQEVQSDKRQRGKKNIASNPENLSTNVVILKYGSDKHSRQKISKNIEEIFTSTPGQKNLSPAKPERKSPGKATHPFFLSKPINPSSIRPLMTKDAGQMEAISRLPTEQDRGGSPTKKVNKPPGADAAAWAAVAGFGCRSSCIDQPKFPKSCGILEPILPPKGLVHVRGLLEAGLALEMVLSETDVPRKGRRLKEKETRVQEREEVLYPYISSVRNQKAAFHKEGSKIQRSSTLHLPHRKVMTGRKLQEAVRQNIHANLPPPSDYTTVNKSSPNLFDNISLRATGVPDSLIHVYNAIASSLTAFDKFECETQEWIYKYAPKCASEVLQPGRDVKHLRDWLKSLTVSSVNFGGGDLSRIRESAAASQKAISRKKKKRKKLEELDGFIISTDEEADEMDVITEPEDPGPPHEVMSTLKRSMIRVGDTRNISKSSGIIQRSTNAVVVSGPHGCGKTAAVYAVAKELDFEVFEINSGSRRSGKDILEKVGDMTKNHLVNRAAEHERVVTDEATETNLADDGLVSGSRSSMISFLEPKRVQKSKPKTESSKTAASELTNNGNKPTHHKQSLVLVEEVDILFEDDKAFWVTILELVAESKRPIIMTCSDEGRLPLEEMNLHAIFRFTPSPESLMTDYMLLVAANEGHLLSRESVSTLYRSKYSDLRASLAELNFFCQMGVGDAKGGLEWMLKRNEPEEHRDNDDDVLRVVSEDTYVQSMDLLVHEDYGSAQGLLENDIKLLTDARHGWNLDVEDWHSFTDTTTKAWEESMTPQRSLKTLESFELAFDALSAGDLFPGLGVRAGLQALLDTSQPVITERMRSNYIENINLLDATPLEDQTGMSTSIDLALKVCSRTVLLGVGFEDILLPLNEETLNRTITRNAESIARSSWLTRDTITAAFDSITEPVKAPLSASKVRRITSFDGPLSIISEDLAPYVRSIVIYDTQLERKRLQLNNLLSEGGRNGKRIRTTRASRAALEGGSKAHTRKERWFPFGTNFSLVLETGGENWPHNLISQANDDKYDTNASYNASRRSSMTTGTGSDA